jgi:hypothetical protein
MDRRAVFFAGAALVCALLIPVTEGDYRWVPVSLTVVYLLLALGSWADRRSRRPSR